MQYFKIPKITLLTKRKQDYWVEDYWMEATLPDSKINFTGKQKTIIIILQFVDWHFT